MVFLFAWIFFKDVNYFMICLFKDNYVVLRYFNLKATAKLYLLQYSNIV